MKNNLTYREKYDIISNHFGTSYPNVEKLLRIIYNAYNANLIEHKEEYRDLISFYCILCSTPIDAIEEIKNNNKYVETLYDAYKEVQYKTFEDIKKSCYKLDEKDVDIKLSKEGVKVYNIEKNDCNFLVSVTQMAYENGEFSHECNPLKSAGQHLANRCNLIYFDNIKNKTNLEYRSLSFVNNIDIKTYNDITKYITFVYPANIPNEYLVTVCNSDAWTINNNGVPYSNREPFYGTAEQLLETTRFYNEIAVLKMDNYHKNSESLMPCAILCNKNITETQYALAKELNLPILFSDSDYQYSGHKDVMNPEFFDNDFNNDYEI